MLILTQLYPIAAAIVSLTVAASLGIRMITDDNKLLFPLRRKALVLEAMGWSLITKPTITCAPCMASFWGIVSTCYVVCITEAPLDWVTLVICGASILLSSFINGFLWGLFKLLELTGKKIYLDVQQSRSNSRKNSK
jgi:hypothetical protein